MSILMYALHPCVAYDSYSREYSRSFSSGIISFMAEAEALREFFIRNYRVIAKYKTNIEQEWL